MSSKRRQRRKDCGRKVPYRTRDAAMQHVRRLRRRARPHEHIHAYLCPFCAKWHVGHQRSSVQRHVRNRRQR